jgi:cell volume regulation protein A
LGVLILGLVINIRVLDVGHHEVEALHTFALALLLFYAGLNTDLKSIRGFLEYGLLLAIGGAVISTMVLGAGVYWLASHTGASLAPGLEDAIPLGAALLIAACLGSTDADATLSVLRRVKRHVPTRVRDLLEFESSVNDPAALIIFSVVVSFFTSSSSSSTIADALLTALSNLLQKMGSGLLMGLVFGYVAKFIIDKFVANKEQLLIVAMSIAFIVYGCTYFLGGSGFVAVYVTGLFMTNVKYSDPEINHTTIQEVLLPFNTMTEISIVLLFGLLLEPAQLLPSLPVGLVTGAVLMLVARPLSVLAFQWISPFNRSEALLITWCGFRGAVPLALSFDLAYHIPQLRGLPAGAAQVLADNCQSIVFVVVMMNLLLQGLSLPLLCRRLSGRSGPVLSS